MIESFHVIPTGITSMIAFHGKPTVKAYYLDRVEKHYLADQIVQGLGWENGKGCFIGCTLHGYEADRYEQFEAELGFPRAVAALLEAIFEGLPALEAKEFTRRSFKAVPEGADLSQVIPRFLHWLLTSPVIGLASNAGEIARPSVEGVALLFIRLRAGDPVSQEEWSAARSAAGSAARSAWSAETAARSAAWSAARSARSARSAAWSAETAARSAESAGWSAWSAAWSAWSAAESAARSAGSAAWSAWSAAESAAWSAWSAAESAARSAAESAESAGWSTESAAESACWSAMAQELLVILSSSSGPAQS